MMVARNHRAVISVRGRFENFIHRGCNKTNIIGSRHHLLLVCCHGGAKPYRSICPLKKQASGLTSGTVRLGKTNTLGKKKSLILFFEKIFQKKIIDLLIQSVFIFLI